MRVAMTEHAVVIAGGGPTGLTLAGEHGTRCPLATSPCWQGLPCSSASPLF